MTPHSAISLFDVAIVRFAFEDKPEVSKPRPAVVVGMDSDYLFVVMAKITSHAPRAEFPGEVVLEDWKAEGLLSPSTVRCSKIVKIPISEIRQIIGTLSNRDIGKVLAGLEAVEHSL